MKKIATLTFLVLTIITTIMLTGCDPEKVGGGGKLQPYDSSTGRYK